MNTPEQADGVIARDGEGLVELEKALDTFLATADPARHALVVIRLDLGAARVLRNALQLARLNGASIQ